MIYRLLVALLLLVSLSAKAAPTYTVYEVTVTADSDAGGAVTDVEFTFLKPGATCVSPAGSGLAVARDTEGEASTATYGIECEGANKLICTAEDGPIGADGERQTDTFRMVVRDQQSPKLIVTTRTESGKVSTVVLRELGEEIENSLGITVKLTSVFDESDIGEFD